MKFDEKEETFGES